MRRHEDGHARPVLMVQQNGQIVLCEHRPFLRLCRPPATRRCARSPRERPASPKVPGPGRPGRRDSSRLGLLVPIRVAVRPSGLRRGPGWRIAGRERFFRSFVDFLLDLGFSPRLVRFFLGARHRVTSCGHSPLPEGLRRRLAVRLGIPSQRPPNAAGSAARQPRSGRLRQGIFGMFMPGPGP